LLKSPATCGGFNLKKALAIPDEGFFNDFQSVIMASKKNSGIGVYLPIARHLRKVFDHKLSDDHSHLACVLSFFDVGIKSINSG
jgi:hypothetical protein